MSLPWTDENKEEFISYINKEMTLAKAERGGAPERWQKWRRMREAEPEAKEKNYPFLRASNVRVPLTSIVTNTAYGKAKQAFKLSGPLVTISPINTRDEGAIDDGKLLTKYYKLLMSSSTDMDLESVLPVMIYEMVSMGYSPVKVSWLRDEWAFKRTGEGGADETVVMRLHDGPMWEPMPLEDFWARTGYTKVDRMPWVGHELHIPWHMLKNKYELGEYENVDLIQRYTDNQAQEWREAQAQQRDTTITPNDTYTLYEFYARWDVDDDGLYEDIVVLMHLETGVMLTEGYNEIGIRPYDVSNYMFRPYELEGRGTCQMTEYAQESADMMHNTRNDNIHVANNRMYMARRGSGIRSNEQMYPGKIMMMDRPGEDLAPVPTVEVYPSSLQAENLDFMYGQKNAGTSDVDSGFADQTLRSRDTFGGQMLRAQNSGGIFSSVIEQFQSSISRLTMITHFFLVANRRIVIDNERRLERLSEEEIERLDRVLMMRVEDIPRKFKFNVDVMNLDLSFEAQRQNTLTVFQIYSMYVEKVMPLLNIMYNPQMAQMMPPELKEAVSRFFVGFTKLMEDTLVFFGKGDTDEFVGHQFERVDALLDMRDALMKQIEEFRGGLQNAFGPGSVRNTGGVSQVPMGPGGPVEQPAVSGAPVQAQGPGPGTPGM